ncbi:MAG TPA: 5'-methylthioadenosine/S-adenosylhomocysteine nucleosidase, partial [Bellilinea sp.]|nr:5'-methylthioadenosine/S-adenosylhomocysteine nucleosidase [Bellilinea sp.]
MPGSPVVILISANAEWRVVLAHQLPETIEKTPYGEVFEQELAGIPCIFIHGGWGKIAAAGSTQYAIDHWQPELLINLGTCGGFAGRVMKGEIILAESTLVYDIVEQMHDPQEAIDAYATRLDLSWLGNPVPLPVRRERLLSADRDIMPAELPQLIKQYQATAADWESGAIAWVASRNQRRCLILRGVTDLVGVDGGEAYGEPSVFVSGTHTVMQQLLDSLPEWLRICG